MPAIAKMGLHCAVDSICPDYAYHHHDRILEHLDIATNGTVLTLLMVLMVLRYNGTIVTVLMYYWYYSEAPEMCSFQQNHT